MRIELEKAEEPGGRFSETYKAGDLAFDESELRLIEPVRVKGQTRRKSGQLEITGELQTRVSIPCGRCLKEVELPIDVEFAERFAGTVSWRNEEQHELSREDLDLGLVDEAIELDDLVKEEILLAVPGQVLCNENCKGICPNCGADRNLTDCGCEVRQVDARWQKLKDLRS
jgi:uncharacterized protein